MTSHINGRAGEMPTTELRVPAPILINTKTLSTYQNQNPTNNYHNTKTQGQGNYV